MPSRRPVPSGIVSPDSPIRAVLLRAFADVRPGLDEVAARMAASAPEDQRREYDPEATGQFINAFETLMIEALEAAGDEKRRFVFDTAIPAMVAQGQTPVDLTRGHVAFFSVLAHRMLERVPREDCPGAEIWLSQFLGNYCAEVVDRAQRAQRAERDAG